MKNLALGFCSLRPVQLPEDVCDAREKEYLICLKQLIRVLPESFDLLVCENTIDSPDQIKNQELSNKDLYSIDKESAYYYSGGWHIKGVYSLILGFIFSASTIWNTNLMFLQSYAWIIGAFVAWITYYLLAKK